KYALRVFMSYVQPFKSKPKNNTSQENHMTHQDKTLVEIWKETYPKIRPWVAIILVGAFLTSIVVDSTPYKIGILSALAGNIIFLIFDLANTLKARLDKIDNNIKEPQPPSYPDFNDALPIIKKTLIERLSR